MKALRIDLLYVSPKDICYIGFILAGKDLYAIFTDAVTYR
jgi:hypothetical protein